MTPHALHSPSHCATGKGGPSYFTLHSAALHLAPIHLNASLPVPCNSVRPTRRSECRWSLRASDQIKYECEDNFLTPSRAPSYPMGPERALKRHLQRATEAPQRKRVKLALPTTDHGATTSLINGPAALSYPTQSHPDIRHHPTLLPRQRPHFVLWIAHMVLIYVVRVRAEDWPRPSLFVPFLLYSSPGL